MSDSEDQYCAECGRKTLHRFCKKCRRKRREEGIGEAETDNQPDGFDTMVDDILRDV